jgi:hypothetical protein
MKLPSDLLSEHLDNQTEKLKVALDASNVREAFRTLSNLVAFRLAQEQISMFYLSKEATRVKKEDKIMGLMAIQEILEDLIPDLMKQMK